MSFTKRWSKPALAEASAAAVPVAGVVEGIGAAATDGSDTSELVVGGGSCSSVLAIFNGDGSGRCGERR
jgi:hypothetical protein